MAIGHVGFKPNCAPGQERIGVDADQPGKASYFSSGEGVLHQIREIKRVNLGKLNSVN